MNHYRFRLVLATASLTAALTVLSLKLGGFISPPNRSGVLLTVSHHSTKQGVSPYRLNCTQQLASLENLEQIEGPPQRLFDPQGRVIPCKSIDQSEAAHQ